ncbi:hypothetical protein NOR_01992 [Metarhizium rileyi]|uniref:CAIB/BAIF family enzyme n=1 Tax=Metarhizium rileyi (strain RCEF 4871) TaxID=1649241 RepID=A0A167I737_METRR|nr:hypothetical protein NOR_01992 [Metarhizium rileyi RCEF 4871]
MIPARGVQPEGGCIAVKIIDDDYTPLAPSTTESNDTQVTADKTPGFLATDSKYTPQFKSAAALILSRIRRTNDCFGSSKETSSRINNEIGKKGVVGELVEPLTMPLSLDSAPSLRLATNTTHQEQIASVFSSLQRKRKPEVEVPNFMQSTIACPKSMIDSHFPPSLAERDKSKTASGNLQVPGGLASEATDGTIREARLSAITNGIAPAKAELLGFYAGLASDADRTQYFLGKKRTDLLNILSFCDQIRPQLLADILVSVSKRHPDLPIFDTPKWERPIPPPLGAQISAAVRSAGPVGRPRHSHSVLNSKSRQGQKNAKKALKRLMMAQHNVEPSEDDDVEEDVLPPGWPKPGGGLYSKLPPETEDRAFLADNNDDESFSHFMIDDLGKPMIISTCA